MRIVGKRPDGYNYDSGKDLARAHQGPGSTEGLRAVSGAVLDLTKRAVSGADESG